MPTRLTRIPVLVAGALSALSGLAAAQPASQSSAPAAPSLPTPPAAGPAPAACPNGYEALCSALPTGGGSGGLGSQAGTGGRSTVIVNPDALAGPTFSWSDTVGLLMEERSRAEACVGLLKGAGNKAVIQQSRATYDDAKAAADDIIAGLTVALVRGGRSADLPRISADFDRFSKGLQDVCYEAIKTTAGQTKGVFVEVAKAPVMPGIEALKSSAAALWTRQVERDELERETIKYKLEAAKLPEFNDIAAQ
jgi:hypothetical protein